jgi:uncharacterized protein (TIGR03118 family)
MSTLYDGLGNMLSLVVCVPSASGSDPGVPTGIVFNGSNDFVVRSGAAAGAARFIFASEDGLISGWSPGVDATHAIHAVFLSSAVYKGLTLASNGGVNMLYAADFHGHKIDVFGPNFTPRKCPARSSIRISPPTSRRSTFWPSAGAWTSRVHKRKDGNDEVDGPGLGIVDAFDTSGHLLQRVATGGTLNAPWGMAIAPANNGSTAHNLPSNTLFFAAGPNGEENGVFGRIDAASP